MKRAAVIILALVVSLVFWVNYNNNPGRIVDRLISSCGLKEGALVYRIELFGFIPVGDALFQQPKEEKLDSVKVYHLSVNAKSLKIVSPFLNGSAEFDSYVDKESGNPVLFRQKISLKGRGELVREAAYDQANRIMTIGGVRREILPDTQDNLSVIFKVRRSVPDKLKDFDFSINTNQKNYMLKGGSSEGVLALKGKTYRTLLLKADISRRDKNPYHKSSISMLLLRDESNLPILIKIFSSGGLIYARLIEIR